MHRGPGLGTGEPGCHPGHHGDGKLQALGTVDSHDSDAVIVCLGKNRFGDASVVDSLSACPFQIGAEVGSSRIGPRPGLVYHESQAPPDVSRSSGGDGALQHRSLPDYAFKQSCRCEPVTVLVEFRKVRQRVGDWVALVVVGYSIVQREVAFVFETPCGQIVITTAVHE